MNRTVANCVVVSAALFFSLSGCRKAGETVTIGVVAMLSGENADNGADMSAAARLAADEANAAGGFRAGGNVVKVKLIIEDDAGEPEKALSAARKLIYTDRAAAIVGPQFSRSAIPVARLAESAGVVMIAPMSTNPETTAGKRYVFRVPYLDTFQGSVMARFARRELSARKAAVLYDVASEYNRTLAEVFKATFVEGGGKVVAFETYTTDRNADYSDQLARIRGKSPEVIFLPNYASDAISQGRQARALGLHATLLGGDGWDIVDMAREPAFDGAYMCRHWDPSIATQKAGRFIEAFSAARGKAPGDVAATTYDALGLLFAAMESGGGATSEAIQRGMRLISGYEGITGKFEYGTTGDPVKSAVIVRIKDGEAKVHSVIEP